MPSRRPAALASVLLPVPGSPEKTTSLDSAPAASSSVLVKSAGSRGAVNSGTSATVLAAVIRCGGPGSTSQLTTRTSPSRPRTRAFAVCSPVSRPITATGPKAAARWRTSPVNRSGGTIAANPGASTPAASPPHPSPPFSPSRIQSRRSVAGLVTKCRMIPPPLLSRTDRAASPASA